MKKRASALLGEPLVTVVIYAIIAVLIFFLIAWASSNLSIKGVT